MSSRISIKLPKMISNKATVLCVALSMAVYYWHTKIKRGPMCNCNKDLSGKTILITGGNTGIGKVAAIEFAKMGARVIIASRNIERSEAAKKEIIQLSGNSNIATMHLDLGDFDSIRKFAKDFDSREKWLDILVNNAGVLGLRGISKYGFNQVFTINHLGPFLLTNLLLEKMKKQSHTRPVRIVNLSSEMYKTVSSIDYDFIKEATSGIIDAYQMYGTSKLASILFTSELHRRYSDHDITSYSLTPGVVYSEIEDNMPYYFAKFNSYFLRLVRRPVVYGAQTILHCSLSPVTTHSGEYFKDCGRQEVWEAARNSSAANLLWEKSAQVTQLI